MARKDFQKGMVAGAEPFEAKFQEQAEAVERVGKRVEEGLGKISAVQNVILNDLSAREKKELYDLNTYVDISELEDTEKELLMAIIYTLSDMTEEVTEEQQAYIRSVKAYLNATEVQILPDLEIIENIDSKSVEKAILQCVMEFLFLENCDHGYRDEYADVLGYFSIKEKEIEKIIANINTIYKAIGAIGLGEKYGYVPVEEEEEFGADDFYDEDIDISTMEDYEISEILHIAQDEVKTIRNKQVHLKAYVDCSGTLEFEHCVIYYNENEADEITLNAGASLKIRNSIVVCKGADKTSFITGKENNCVVIEKTTFENCSKFIRLSSCQELSITRCELKNCGDGFLYVSGMSDAGVFNVSENAIYENDIAEFNREGMQHSAELMYVYSYGEACLFDNNSIVESKEFSCIGRNEEDRENSIIYFSGNIKVRNCTFEGVSTGIKAKEVEGCKFQDCQNAIETEKGAKVDNCSFENCTRIVVAERNVVISNCKFVSCYDELLSVDSYGGVVIEFCQFIDTRYLGEAKVKRRFWGYGNWPSLACITLRRSKESSSRYNSIKKCIFDGVEIGKDYFLIAAYGYEKPSGTVSYIEECTFTNCKTARSTGKIIKEYISYDTTFKKDQSFRANEIRNCKGLDNVVKVSEESKKMQANVIQSDNASATVLQENEDVKFKMVVEDVFTITGRGTVATGKIEEGVIKVDDEVELRRLDGTVKITKVTGIEKDRVMMSSAGKGAEVGILLKGVQRTEIERGAYLVIVQK